MHIAKMSDEKTIDGDRLKANSSSANVPKFNVEILKNSRTEANSIPRVPPASESASDSVRKAAITFLLRNPSARSVPTSIVLFATAAYIVIIAPMVAPMLKMTVTKIPSTLMNNAMVSDWRA